MLTVERTLVKPQSFELEGLRLERSFSFMKAGSPRSIPTPRRSPTKNVLLEHSISFKNWEPEIKTSGEPNSGGGAKASADGFGETLDFHPEQQISPSANSDQDAAAVKLQKCYKSYRTRRNLADCAVLTELWYLSDAHQPLTNLPDRAVLTELWWKTLDSVSLKLHSDVKKHETPVKKWARAKKRVAKVGKGLSKDEKAQKLALQHWLEAIDARHRYGHNLNLYYDVWFRSESTDPFFYWLDVGSGKEVNLEKCPRSKLLQQCIKYLGPSEREAYEVIVKEGKLVYKKNNSFVNTEPGSKWIFVLSTTRNLYIGKKQKGTFQHSSFLCGAATTSAGRLVAEDGTLKAIWPYSGHYLPTEENFKAFISFLVDNNVDLTDVKKCAVDDDQDPLPRQPEVRLSPRWNSGTGARISCLRDYPADIQAKALEQVNLSPRVTINPLSGKIPIPSPRPSPKLLISPRLASMGFASPRIVLKPPTPRRS